MRLRSFVRAALAAGVVVILLLGVGGWLFVRQHHQAAAMTATDAERAFADERARLPRGAAIVTIHDGGEPSVHRGLSRTGVARTLYCTVFDTRSQRLVRINLPLAVVRVMRPGGFTYLGEITFLEDTDFDADRVDLTLDDLDARGPGLLVDHQHADGGQILVWLE